jgi:hypothetical protein
VSINSGTDGVGDEPERIGKTRDLADYSHVFAVQIRHFLEICNRQDVTLQIEEYDIPEATLFMF